MQIVSPKRERVNWLQQNHLRTLQNPPKPLLIVGIDGADFKQDLTVLPPLTGVRCEARRL
jgi:hypothetical protein